MQSQQQQQQEPKKLPGNVKAQCLRRRRRLQSLSLSTLRVKHNSKSIIIVELPAEATRAGRGGERATCNVCRSQAGEAGSCSPLAARDCTWNMKIVACSCCCHCCCCCCCHCCSKKFQTHILIPHSLDDARCSTL